VTYLVEVPVEGGGRLLVEAADAELPADLELASARPGAVVTRARESLEEALDQIRPAVSAVSQRLRAMAPDELTVEFGLILGAEAGAIVARGTAEVHFTVTLTWRCEASPAGRQPRANGQPGAGGRPGADG
jgi:hypothetical protein